MNHYHLDDVHQHLNYAKKDTYYCPEEWSGTGLPKIYDSQGQILATWQKGHKRFTVFVTPQPSKVSLSGLVAFDSVGFSAAKMLHDLMY